MTNFSYGFVFCILLFSDKHVHRFGLHVPLDLETPGWRQEFVYVTLTSKAEEFEQASLGPVGSLDRPRCDD